MSNITRCGFVAIIGRPNVGKSTLLNHLLGKKISITARKPQTTRHRVLGIRSHDNVQSIYVDTPGLHTTGKKALNRALNKAALSAMLDVDVVVFMVEAKRWTDDDEWILNKLTSIKRPVLLVVNKVDRLQNKNEIIPYIEEIAAKFPFVEVVPLSAMEGDNVSALEQSLAAYLPEGVHLFPEDQFTDQSERFYVSEIIREKLIRNLGQEVPHALAVSLEKFAEEKGIQHIAAVIWVEREGQKKIVIGKQGAVLKKIGTMARQELEQHFGKKVFLQCWVKVKKSWSDDVRALRSLGFDDKE